MALILSIETSTTVCSAALHRQGNLVAYSVLDVAHSHAESLLAIITHLVGISRCKVEDLDAIAISEGPGSYTGLRIGATTATGLAYGLDIPLIAINTLAAMVNQVIPFHAAGGLYCPMIDARRMEVYCRITDRQGVVYQPIGSYVITEHSFANILATNVVFFFGDGAAKCIPVLANHANARVIEGVYPSALHMGLDAYEKFKQQDFVGLTTFEPLYLKTPPLKQITPR